MAPSKTNKTFHPYKDEELIKIPIDAPIEEHVRILLGPPDLTGTSVLPAPLKDEKKKLDTALGKNDPNPYIRARAEVLGKLKKSAIEKIEQMEKEGKTDDRFYKEFMQQVIALGDKLSLDKPK